MVKHNTNRKGKSRGSMAPIKKRIVALRNKLGKRPRPQGAIAKFTHRPNQIEVKTLDMLFTGASAAVYTPDTVPLQVLNCSTNTTCIQALNLIQQGPGTSQRIGHKVSLKSVRIRLNSFLGNVNVLPSVSHVRVMVVYDHNPDGVYIATNQILSNITQANVVQNGQYTDSLNPNFFERMVILMDKFITLVPVQTGAVSTTSLTGPSDQTPFVIDEFVNLKNLETVFGNTVNGLQTANPMTIAYIQTGALYILTLGDTGGGQCWNWQGSARLRFRDN